MLFERQKALLTLLDALGGEVANMDFQKLLFLWSHELGNSAYYDFVPFRYVADALERQYAASLTSAHL